MSIRAAAASLRIRAGILGVMSCAVSGCLTPPALLPARAVDSEKALAAYPSGCEPVAIETEPGVVLRGVFVPSDEGAPIVLHLLESSGSAASTQGGYAALTQQLSDLGFASLLVDYTGVGASSGKVSPKNLERDTRAIWADCVRRAGGDPRRVVIRATSIGTLAAGTLLDSGARPGAMILVLPVMPDTVVERAAREFRGPISGWIAATLYSGVIELDLPGALRRADMPIIAISSQDEQLIDADERELLRHAIESSGGAWCERPGGHLEIACRAREMLPQEAVFLRALHTPPAEARAQACVAALPPEVAVRFAGGSPERARLEQVCACADEREPLSTAAIALTCADASEGWRMRRLIPRLAKSKDFDALCAVCSLDDPAGPLPLDELERMCQVIDTFERFDVMTFHPRPGQLAFAGKHGGRGLSFALTVTFTNSASISIGFDSVDTWSTLRSRGLTHADTERQLGRLLLKAYGFADRLRPSEDGSITVEVLDQGAWRAFEAPPEDQYGTIDFRIGNITGVSAPTGNRHDDSW